MPLYHCIKSRLNNSFYYFLCTYFILFIFFLLLFQFPFFFLISFCFSIFYFNHQLCFRPHRMLPFLYSMRSVFECFPFLLLVISFAFFFLLFCFIWKYYFWLWNVLESYIESNEIKKDIWREKENNEGKHWD